MKITTTTAIEIKKGTTIIFAAANEFHTITRDGKLAYMQEWSREEMSECYGLSETDLDEIINTFK